MLKLNADQPKLEFQMPDGTKQVWEFDVVELKLEAERLEAKHNLIDGEKLRPPTTAFLADFCEALKEKGMPVCTFTLALRVYSLVAVQFSQLSRSLAEQLATME